MPDNSDTPLDQLTLRQMQARWNELVPQAQAMGVRRVKLLNAPLETKLYRLTRLQWLISQIGTYDAILDYWSFGPEIECTLPRAWSFSRLADQISTTGVDCRTGGGHSTRTWWKVVWEHTGVEVVGPKLKGKSGLDDVAKVTKCLTDLGCRVNVNCGFHVHVGVEDQYRSGDVDFFKRLIRLYAEAEDIIDSFMAPSRRLESARGFARSLKRRVNWQALERAQFIDEVVRAIGQRPGRANYRERTRYCKLNLQALYGEHGCTVEFRQHQGSVEGSKIINWIKFLLRMCTAARDPSPKNVASFDALAESLRLSQHEKDFFAGRITEFRQREGRE